MQITYLGHAGFCVETSRSIVVMDPWVSPTGAFDSAWFRFPCNHHLAALIQEKLQDTTKNRYLYISHEHIGMIERSDRVELRTGTPKDVHEHYDLLLSLDVFEHIEDYIGFLRSLRPIADWFIFHVPLDVSAQSVIRERPLLAARSNIGHLNYFTYRTALASLETAGFEIVCDRLLLPNDMPDRRIKTRIANIPRGLGRRLRPQLSARILGGSTLLVLASVQNSGSFLTTP
jgi:hypothetical protein